MCSSSLPHKKQGTIACPMPGSLSSVETLRFMPWIAGMNLNVSTDERLPGIGQAIVPCFLCGKEEEHITRKVTGTVVPLQPGARSEERRVGKESRRQVS